MIQSIIAYNPILTTKLIKGRPSRVLDPFLVDVGLYDKYQQVFGKHINAQIDRTGQLPHFFNIKLLDPLPEARVISFEDATRIRAQELIAQNKPITVLWSGGLDSTFTLMCLLEYAQPGQVSVFGTYASIIEAGELFDKYIRDRVKYTIGVFGLDLAANKECLYVSGMLGNQIFGPGNWFNNTGTPFKFGTLETIHKDYKTVVDPEILEILDPSIQAYPGTIETVEDFRCFMMFNFPWQGMKYEQNIYFPLKDYGEIHAFFDSTEIQQWAMSTKEPKQLDPADNLTHRWQMRQLIDRWIGPNNYTSYKDKAVSVLYTKKHEWFALLDNYTNIYFKDAPTYG